MLGYITTVKMRNVNSSLDVSTYTVCLYCMKAVTLTYSQISLQKIRQFQQKGFAEVRAHTGMWTGARMTYYTVCVRVGTAGGTGTAERLMNRIH